VRSHDVGIKPISEDFQLLLILLIGLWAGLFASVPEFQSAWCHPAELRGWYQRYETIGPA
jgi:hypothetical protein